MLNVAFSFLLAVAAFAQGNVPPQAVSVAPNSGSGFTQTFRFVFSDANGGADIALALLLFNQRLHAPLGCFLLYDRPNHRLYLAADPASHWLNGWITPGGTGALSNSFCRVDAAGSSAAASGNQLTIDVALTFLPAFAGLKAIHGFAVDVAGAGSAWTPLGTWMVPGVAVNLPPHAVSMTPDSGSGWSQTFQFLYADRNGYRDLERVYGIFNDSLGAATACFFEYTPETNTLRLSNDRGNDWLPTRLILGRPGTVENSQCQVHGADSGAAGDGANLSLKLRIEFRPPWEGLKVVFGFAVDQAGLHSGWTPLGFWRVPSAPNVAPVMESVRPDSGGGAAQVFRFRATDGNGARDIHLVLMLWNESLSPFHGCFVMYNHQLGRIFLANDLAVAWLGDGVSPVATPVLENSQCRVLGFRSSIAASVNELVLDVSMQFKPAFAGLKGTYGFALDRANAHSGWTKLGEWIVP